MVVSLFCINSRFIVCHLRSLGVVNPYSSLSMHCFCKSYGYYLKNSFVYIASHRLVAFFMGLPASAFHGSYCCVAHLCRNRLLVRSR